MVAFSVMGQENARETRKAAKEKQREARKAAIAKENAANRALITKLVNERAFVLEAQYLSDDQGNMLEVNSDINFIIVKGDKASFQFGDPSMIGYNGVGGITVVGDLQAYKIMQHKKGDYIVSFDIFSNVGTLFVTIDIVPENLRAEATIRGNTANALNYTGKIVPLDKSRIYQGNAF